MRNSPSLAGVAAAVQLDEMPERAVAAVDLPEPFELGVGPRRHRRITGPSGLLVALCFVLPMVDGCGDRAIYPFDMPLLWQPYVYGAVLALAAAATTSRGLRWAIYALRVIAVLSVVEAACMIVVCPPLGVLWLVPSVLVLCAASCRGVDERSAAATATLTGALQTLWFGLMAASPHTLIGGYLSLIGSLGTFVGGLAWLGELSSATPAALLPRARAR